MSPNDSMQIVESAIKIRKRTNRCYKKRKFMLLQKKIPGYIDFKTINDI
jgi:hypothetical protein